jgi:hypothetical protein
MAPGRCNLVQGQQDEGTPMHLGVWQPQLTWPSLAARSRLANPAAAEIKDIDVELPWSPVAAKTAPSAALDPLQRPQ